MRKLEIHGLSVSVAVAVHAASRSYGCFAVLWLITGRVPLLRERWFVMHLLNNREGPAPAGTVVCDAFALSFKLRERGL